MELKAENVAEINYLQNFYKRRMLGARLWAVVKFFEKSR